MTRSHTSSITFQNARNGRLVCEKTNTANTFLSRFVGLLGHRSLPMDEGLWLVPSSSVHTFGMRFTIDVIFLDDSLQVVELAPALRPWRVAGLRSGARTTLEVSPGSIARANIQVGDTLQITRPANAP